jgi:CheY-like chemotaxis protein
MSEEFKVIDILLVEDSEGDIRLIKESLKDGKLRNRLFAVNTGVEAMDYLFMRGDYADAVRPDLIILDLNLPQMDGREVLAEIKADNSLKRIPVVILTTSSSEKDILETYSHHANCYIVKPLDLNQFFSVVKSIENFWLSIFKLPDEDKQDER